mgnify:CR=1 FL=1
MAVDANKPIWQLEAEARKKKKDSFKPKSALDNVQTGLTGAGITPGLGIAPDLLNVLISLFRGKGTDALVNVGSAIPGPVGIGIGGSSLAKDFTNKKKKVTKNISDAQIFNKLKNV